MSNLNSVLGRLRVFGLISAIELIRWRYFETKLKLGPGPTKTTRAFRKEHKPILIKA